MLKLQLWCYTQVVEATLGLGKENYPYTQMIISSFPGKNPNIISQAFSWDINLRGNHSSPIKEDKLEVIYLVNLDNA